MAVTLVHYKYSTMQLCTALLIYTKYLLSVYPPPIFFICHSHSSTLFPCLPISSLLWIVQFALVIVIVTLHYMYATSLQAFKSSFQCKYMVFKQENKRKIDILWKRYQNILDKKIDIFVIRGWGYHRCIGVPLFCTPLLSIWPCMGENIHLSHLQTSSSLFLPLSPSV